MRKNLARQDLKIELDDQALDYLADLGYDPQFGARPLKRVIQRELVNELSRHVLAGTFNPGETIYVGTDAKGLTFNVKKENSTEVKQNLKPRSNGKSDKVKNLENLKKATKDVEDAVKDLKAGDGNKPTSKKDTKRDEK